MRMSRFNWSVHVVKYVQVDLCLQCGLENVVRFERIRNDDSRTLYVLTKFFELLLPYMLLHLVQFWRI